jgi:hypothetical protein
LLQFCTSWGTKMTDVHLTLLGMAIILALVGSSWLVGPAWAADDSDTSSSTVSAEADDGEVQREVGSGQLESRYQPREPEKKSWYNSDYIFGMTRGVTGSTIAPAGQVPLLVLTVPLDIVFLPFALIGGLFG